jgi:hypothetical protein
LPDTALALMASTDLTTVFDGNSQKDAAKAYYDWWNPIHIFRDKLTIDRLRETDN